MDYNIGYALTFKCIFCYDFNSMFFIGTQYIIYGNTYMNWKKLQQNFNQQIIMDFWIIKFGPYFQKFESWSFFIGLIYISPLKCMLKSFLDRKPFIWILLIY